MLFSVWEWVFQGLCPFPANLPTQQFSSVKNSQVSRERTVGSTEITYIVSEDQRKLQESGFTRSSQNNALLHLLGALLSLGFRKYTSFPSFIPSCLCEKKVPILTVCVSFLEQPFKKKSTCLSSLRQQKIHSLTLVKGRSPCSRCEVPLGISVGEQMLPLSSGCWQVLADLGGLGWAAGLQSPPPSSPCFPSWFLESIFPSLLFP